MTLAGVSRTAKPVHGFAMAQWRGESTLAAGEVDLEAQIARVTDPGTATETVHWGRNYLYRTVIDTSAGPMPVVVKQFRNQGRRKVLERRLRGSKAERSWYRALEFCAAEIPTAQPLLWIESTKPDGPSFFVSRFLEDMAEARFVFRAVNEGALAERFPGFELDCFLDSLGAALRRMHDAGLYHRDLSIGNVLLPKGVTRPAVDDLHIIDLNRARLRARVSLIERTRDLCRLAIFRPADQRRFLSAYWQGSVSPLRWWTYKLWHHGFLFKIGSKKWLRAPWRGLSQWLKPRRAHVHIPEAPQGASDRDKIVWDHLSDQPHQHASKLAKLKVRLADAPSHVGNTATFLASVPRTYRRYRQLHDTLYQQPVPWQGAGVCVRPCPEAPTELLAAVEDLGARHVLLRLHPWQETHDDEEELAQQLQQRGFELSFSLPQNRDLVRQPELWRQRIEDLARRFTPYGRAFQIGQAINRSKWGVWNYNEYLRLATIAQDVLKQFPGVETLGPAVIDFELHATAAVLNHRRCPSFDAAASLLYVDRRGAPENRQLGFDTVDKILLAKAIADTAKRCGPRSWVTEVNWPLWEGPHSPAGKSVSVSEQEQANFLVRYYLLSLTTGAVERVFWWQMIARGYGLIAPDNEAGSGVELRRRASFQAFAVMERLLASCTFEGLQVTPEGSKAMLFRQPTGKRLLAAWSLNGTRSLQLPEPALAGWEQDGSELKALANGEVEIAEAVRYFRI